MEEGRGRERGERERQKEEREEGQEKRREGGGEAGRPNEDCMVETGELYYMLGSHALLAAALGVSSAPVSFAQCQE